MSDEFDVDGILAEFGLPSVKEPEPKKEPVRRKRVVAKAEPKETLITRVEEMRKADEEKHAESVRKFAESLKGKKIAKVKAFLTEIAKKKVAKRKPTELPELTAYTETFADVVKILKDAGWKDTKDLGKEWSNTTVIPMRWEGQKNFSNEVYPTNLLMTPDGKELWRYGEMGRNPRLRKTPLKNGDSLLGGPFIKKAVPEEWKNHKTAWGEIEHYKHYYFHDDYERKFKHIIYEDGKLVIKDE